MRGSPALSRFFTEAFDLVGTAAALAVAVVVSKALRNRSFRANAVALGLFVVLAIFPIRLDVSTEPGTLPPPWGGFAAQVKPVTLKMKLLDGDEFGPELLVDESNVEEAYATRDAYGAYAISLRLDAEGSEIIEKTTAAHRGKRLAVFLDGELICSPEIRERIGGGMLLVSGRFTGEEAERMAAGIEAAKKRTEGGRR